MTYLGSVASDRADYPRAVTLLHQAARDMRAAGAVRPLAYCVSMLGRISLLRGDLTEAATELREAMELAERDHWLSLLPWPQSLLGHTQLGQGDVEGASRTLEQAFARACQIGDPCWEGISARGLALASAASGDVDGAFATLVDARVRSQRLADPYVWLDIYILDALCELGRSRGHPGTRGWVTEMCDRASRTGTRELRVRALVHSAALGNTGDATLAAVLSDDIDNPVLGPLTAPARSPIAGADTSPGPPTVRSRAGRGSAHSSRLLGEPPRHDEGP
jgi:hypothetical protein